MTRILVYSHDAYGLGNIRRMLAIAGHMAGTLEEASVLMVSGSPMVQGFRIAPQIDYIKLPSVTRTVRDGYSTRSLGLDARDTFELRANLILAAVADFRPDVIVIDKKPFGMENELEAAVYYAKSALPNTSLVLVLRDILDEPAATIRAWQAGQYTEAIDRFFDSVLVLGSPAVFDPRVEYALPASVCRKIRFAGYVQKPRGARTPREIRAQFGVRPGDDFVLVTPGGGQDGVRVVETYVAALPRLAARGRIATLIVTGPEMDAAARGRIEQAAGRSAGVQIREFTDDMMSCLEAADLVVCMGGYNTICEVASLRKRAIVVPRVRPVEEQLIRAERLARMGVVSMLHPDPLDAEQLAVAVLRELEARPRRAAATLDMDALPRVTAEIERLLRIGEAAHDPVHAHSRVARLAPAMQPAVAWPGTV